MDGNRILQPVTVAAMHTTQVWTGPRGWAARGWSVALALAAGSVLWAATAFNPLSVGTHY